MRLQVVSALNHHRHISLEVRHDSLLEMRKTVFGIAIGLLRSCACFTVPSWHGSCLKICPAERLAQH